MITVPFSVGALLYTLGACACVLGLWLYHDLRDRGMYDSERRKAIFHCIRCEKLYSGRAGIETQVCPRCGFRNSRLRF